MKTKIILFCSCLFLITTAMAQPKPKKPDRPSRRASKAAESMRLVFIDMRKVAKFKGSTNKQCDPLPYLKALPDKEFIPRKWVLGRSIDKIFKTIRENFEHHKAYVESKSYADFVIKVTGTDVGSISKQDEKFLNEYYRTLKAFQKEEVIVYQKTIPKKQCDYMVMTTLKNTAWEMSKQDGFKRTVFSWDIKTIIKITCKCKGNDPSQLKNAQFEYTGKMQTIMDYDRIFKFVSSKPTKPKFEFMLRNSQCCPPKTPKAEDGSFIDPDPNEPIFFPNQFIEVGAGVATAKDEETELCASVGFMHNLFSEEENNALFIGARAKVNNASFSASDFSQTKINVGPAVEHQAFIGNTETKWINGLNGAFVFGSSDSGGFKTDISGFNIGLYTGVEVALGNQIALGVMASLVEYNNQTFKSDDSEFKSNSTGINLNKGSVGLSLRIDLDSNQ